MQKSAILKDPNYKMKIGGIGLREVSFVYEQIETNF